MKKQPLISIITPSYNSESYIEICIQSIIKQSYINWELIIIDDNSSDSSISIINNLRSLDDRIKLISLKENKGSAYARNIGIECSKGEYIAFLDSDDVWHKDKLLKQVNFMLKNNILFSYTSYYIIDSQGNILKEKTSPLSTNYLDMLKSCKIGCLTAMYNTSILGKIFMPNIRKRQDLGLWLKILKITDSAYCLDEPLAFYRIHKESLSANKLSAAKYQWKLYREIEKLNLFQSIYYFTHYTINGFYTRLSIKDKK